MKVQLRHAVVLFAACATSHFAAAFNADKGILLPSGADPLANEDYSYDATCTIAVMQPVPLHLDTTLYFDNSRGESNPDHPFRGGEAKNPDGSALDMIQWHTDNCHLVPARRRSTRAAPRGPLHADRSTRIALCGSLHAGLSMEGSQIFFILTCAQY